MVNSEKQERLRLRIIQLGRMCDIPQNKFNSRKAIQTLRENSFQVNSPRLFNCLPKKIRNKKRCSIEEFKAELDLCLETIPDEPRSDGYIPKACSQVTTRPSNSIIDQYWWPGTRATSVIPLTTATTTSTATAAMFPKFDVCKG